MGETFHTGLHQPVGYVVERARTVGEVFRRRVERTPDAPASYEKRGGEWRRITWRTLYRQAARAAHGLAELGLEAGDRVAILGPTLVDWTVWDLGGHLAALVTVGIYPKQSPDQVRYILEHSDSRAVFVAEEEELLTVLEAAAGNDALAAIVPWDEELAGRFADADRRIVPPSRFRGEALAEEEISEPGFRDLFVAPVGRGNRRLARVEKVRRFFLLDRDLSQEAGEMTPTMKMKRKAIEERYALEFDRVYSDPDFAVDVEPRAADVTDPS